MSKRFIKAVVAITFVLILGIGGSLYMILSMAAAFQTQGRTYCERDIEFTTYEAAALYQTDVINTAESLGADVEEFTISITSPPTVNWRVTMPFVNEWDTSDITPFPYGERMASPTYVKANLIICAVLAIGGVTVFIWVAIHHLRKNENDSGHTMGRD